jgi:hypothetical protein
VYGLRKFSVAAKNTATDPFVGKFSKEALDRVEPGVRSRDEMQVKARMPLQPLLDAVMLVRGVVVPMRCTSNFRCRGPLGRDGPSRPRALGAITAFFLAAVAGWLRGTGAVIGVAIACGCGLLAPSHRWHATIRTARMSRTLRPPEPTLFRAGSRPQAHAA